MQDKGVVVLGDVLQDARQKNWFWDHNAVFESGLSSNAILVRLYLARCANGGRQAWPSLNTIAARCKVSRATVKRALTELEEKGWLERTRRVRESGERDTTVYLLKSPPAADDRVGSHRAYPVKSDQGGRLTQSLPGQNMTTSGGGVGSQGAYLGSQGAYVGSDVTPNNTHRTIPIEQEGIAAPPLPPTKEKGEQLPVRQALGEKTTGACDAAHARALSREAGAEGKAAHVGGAQLLKEPSKTPAEGKDGAPGADELAAELVDEYRSVEGVAPAKGDRAFMGSLLAEYGYACVLESIEELRRALSVEEIKKPLLYLKAICRRISAATSGASKRGAREKIIGHDEEHRRRRREFLKTLYCN